MPIRFDCEFCGKTLKADDSKAGKKVKCPSCEGLLTIPKPETEPEEAPEIYDAEDATDSSGDDMDDIDDAPAGKIPCPKCGEMKSKRAKVCPWCGDGSTKTKVLEAGDVVSTSWEIYKENVGILVGGVFLAGILINMISIPQTILQAVGEAMGKQGHGDAAMLFGILSLCYIPVSIAGQVFIMTGQNRLLLNVARGKEAAISDLFSGGRYFWRMLGCGILYGLMVGLGTLACLVPGLILGLMFYAYSYVLIDQDLPGIDSLGRAREASKGNLGSLFLIALAAFGVVMLGVLMLCIGVIFTVPLAHLFFAVAYCKMTGRRTAR